MDETTRWAFTQGVLGVWATLTTGGLIYLFRVNQGLHERLAVKSKTDQEVNEAKAARTERLLEVLIDKIKPARGRRVADPDE